MCKEKQEPDKVCGCVRGVRTVTVVGDGLWKCPRCGGFIVGITEAVQKKMDVLEKGIEVLKECDEYLDENNLNNIGNKSTLHMMIKTVLKK